MTATAQETMAALRPATTRLNELIPGVMGTLHAFHDAALDEPAALDVKTRDLIGLAISISKQDDGCVAAYSARCAKHGATADEVAATVGVALLMNGGPAHVWGARALEAFEEWQHTGQLAAVTW
jgi:AhpD family alkylhydroperoxidase